MTKEPTRQRHIRTTPENLPEARLAKKSNAESGGGGGVGGAGGGGGLGQGLACVRSATATTVLHTDAFMPVLPNVQNLRAMQSESAWQSVKQAQAVVFSTIRYAVGVPSSELA